MALLARAAVLKGVSLVLPVAVATRHSFRSAIRHNSVLASARAEPPHIQNVQPIPPQDDELPSFTTLQGVVHKDLLKAVTGAPMNLKVMSPVQARVFPMLPALARPFNPQEPDDSPSRDLLVKAKTGTGKTLGFLLPAVQARLESLEARTDQTPGETRSRLPFPRDVGTLVISPTRELATQIAKEAMRLTSHLRGFGVRLLVGGESRNMQLRLWSTQRRDIVVATPGRLLDLLESEVEVQSGLSKTQVLVLDEADTLLDMGFRDDIEAIKKKLPPVPERQTFLFSATVSPAIQQIAKSTLAPNHEFVNCVSKDTSPVHAHVQQYHTVVPNAKDQLPHVLRLLAQDQLLNPGTSKVIVFLPTTKMTQLYATCLRELSKPTLPAGANTQIYELHSKKSMDSRTRASNNFRNNTSGASVLVTSDVSARGVDYPGVTRVVQVGIPGSTEQYIHRVGRTGRANTQGRGDLVLLPWEMGFARQCLSMVPLAPLRVQDLAADVKELSRKFDEDPSVFLSKVPVQKPSRGRYTTSTTSGQQLFQSPLSVVVDEIDRVTQELVPRLDEEAIRETFMSLLGYYMGKAPELRIRREEILDGLKLWTTEAAGLSVPPYVSPMLLQKLGAGFQSRSNSTRHVGQDYNRKPQEHSWQSRGQQKLKSRDRPFDYGRERSFGRSGGSGGERTFDNNRRTGGAGSDREHIFDRRRAGGGFGGERTFDNNRRTGGGSGGERTFDNNNRRTGGSGFGGERKFDNGRRSREERTDGASDWNRGPSRDF